MGFEIIAEKFLLKPFGLSSTLNVSSIHDFLYLCNYLSISSPKDMFIVLEREEGGEKDRRNWEKKREIMVVREKHWLFVSHMHPDWDWTRNLGMCPDQKSDLQPFGVLDDASTTPGQVHAGFF